MLEISVKKLLGQTKLDVSFVSFVASGRSIALFGPSGSGKTSTLNMIAGLVQPDDGRVVADSVTLFDKAKRVSVPVHKRRIGYVFQEHRLFPHLSVRKNLDYGRRMNRLPHDPDEQTRVLSMLSIEHLLERRPNGLSGGEKQRVAIGRALLSKPRLLLLDEPMASLDEARKEELMPFLERLRDEAGVPMVYVSHTESEVIRMSDTIVLFANGKVVDVRGRND
jgi:molybdate transport system ATP-binding protein